MLSELGSSLIAIPVISILESIAVAKAFGESLRVNLIATIFLTSTSFIGSQRKDDRREPGNDCFGSVQHSGLLRVLYANDRLLYTHCGE